MAWESPYVQEHPNPDLGGDRGKVIGALIILWIFGLLNLAVGGLFMFAPELVFGAQMVQIPKELILILALFSFAYGGAYVLCAVLISAKRSVGAAKTGYVLAIIEACMAVLSFNIISIGINILKVWLIKRGYDALQDLKVRVYAADQANALTGWYHAYIPLLVHVMKADGEIHPAEMEEMNKQCNLMNISEWERDLVFRKSQESLDPIPALAQRYREASEEISMAWSEDRLIQALAAMAAADRVLDDRERAVIKQIAEALNYAPQNLEAKLKQAQSQLSAANQQEALELFGLPEGASREQIDARYAELLEQNDPAQFAHLGDDVAGQVQENRAATERGYKLLVEAS